MRRSDLPYITLTLRHTGELLAHPCRCGRHGCAIGEHVWDATRNMTPGPRAATYDARINGTPTAPDPNPAPDLTEILHDRYIQYATAALHAAQDLYRFLDAHRPDRMIPLPDPSSDDDWCRNHLDQIGVCEPRYRGDLCRWCWDVGRVHGTPPDDQYMRERRDRGRSTPVMEAAFLTRLKAARPNRKRKKAG